MLVITYHRCSKAHKMKASLGDCQYTHTFRPSSTLDVDYFNAVLPGRTEKQRKAHPYVPELSAKTERGGNTAF
jgi:hypothetical protein